EVVRISVRDEGPGIPPEDQERIFARFARGREEGKQRTRGSGVGLAVVREFVELHHGQILLESVPGHGSTFTVALPRSARPGEQVSAPESIAIRSAPPGPPTGTPRPSIPRLLLVEDDDEARVFLTSELGRTTEVVAVADGEAAVRLADQRP